MEKNEQLKYELPINFITKKEIDSFFEMRPMCEAKIDYIFNSDDIKIVLKRFFYEKVYKAVKGTVLEQYFTDQELIIKELLYSWKTFIFGKARKNNLLKDCGMSDENILQLISKDSFFDFIENQRDIFLIEIEEFLEKNKF